MWWKRGKLGLGLCTLECFLANKCKVLLPRHQNAEVSHFLAVILRFSVKIDCGNDQSGFGAVLQSQKKSGGTIDFFQSELEYLATAEPKEKDIGGESHGPLRNWRSLTVYNIMVLDQPWLFTIDTNRSSLTEAFSCLYNLLSTIFDTLSNKGPESVRVAAFAMTGT